MEPHNGGGWFRWFSFSIVGDFLVQTVHFPGVLFLGQHEPLPSPLRLPLSRQDFLWFLLRSKRLASVYLILVVAILSYLFLGEPTWANSPPPPKKKYVKNQVVVSNILIFNPNFWGNDKKNAFIIFRRVGDFPWHHQNPSIFSHKTKIRNFKQKGSGVLKGQSLA